MIWTWSAGAGLCVSCTSVRGNGTPHSLSGDFGVQLHRSTYTSTSSGASPAELASPLNGSVPLKAPIRSAVSHLWWSSSRVGAFWSRSRANRCMLSSPSFANSRAILRRRNTDFSSCAVFAKWPPNRMRLSPLARHSTPPLASSQLILCSMGANRGAQSKGKSFTFYTANKKERRRG